MGRLTLGAWLFLLALSGLWAQDTREIWDDGFRNKRPGQKGGATVSAPKPKPIDYRVSHASGQPAVNLTGVTPVIGVTMWHLRQAAPRDGNAPRLLVPDLPSRSSQEYVSERTRLDEPLHPGDRVRIAIESPGEGFLYVIDRELYSDGTRGVPYLLFPSEILNQGDNRVIPGRLIEIPGHLDRVPALRVDSSDSRHQGEELLVVISMSPLTTIRAGVRNAELPEETLAAWEREFTQVHLRLDLDTQGALWTNAERSAGVAERLLTPDDPMPQSIFATAGDRRSPFMVRIPIQVLQ